MAVRVFWTTVPPPPLSILSASNFTAHRPRYSGHRQLHFKSSTTMEMAWQRVSRRSSRHYWNHHSNSSLIPFHNKSSTNSPQSLPIFSEPNLHLEIFLPRQPPLTMTFLSNSVTVPLDLYSRYIHCSRTFPIYDMKSLPQFRKRKNVSSERGVLTKFPCLCHGVYGNALSLPSHDMLKFLKLTCQGGINWDEEEDPDERFGLFTGEGGRSWAMAIAAKQKEGTILGFNDL